MYSKISANHKKRQIHDFEDEPPDKKIISDGDILIKELAAKQKNTKVNLEEALTAKSRFYKSTKIQSVTSYTSGFISLEQFNTVCQQIDNEEKLKACNLTDNEIKLLSDYKNGQEFMKLKHKNLNEDILNVQLKQIFIKIKHHEFETNKKLVNKDRLKAETSLATKPNSVETKLLKFALENQQTTKDVLPEPMDEIKEVEEKILKGLSPINIKKIRKKARSLARQIDELNNHSSKESNVKSKPQTDEYCQSSKWDLKEISDNKPKEVKVFTCKPQNYYTIKNGEIVKITPSDVQGASSDQAVLPNKLSLEDIKKISRFKNYEKGKVSRVLYLKNLANGVQESDLFGIFGEFSKLIKSINIMKRKMRRQAFVEFKDEEIAEKVLDMYNGFILKNKPIIIQFGKRKS